GMSDTEIATRQQADLKRVVAECKDKFDRLARETNRGAARPSLQAATESLRQHQVDKAHGQFLLLSRSLDAALRNEADRLTAVNKELATLEQALTRAPDRPAVAALRQRRPELAGRVQTLV